MTKAGSKFAAVMGLVALAVALLAGNVSAQTVTYPNGDATPYESYKNVSLDVCDMVAGFNAKKFADVSDIYTNGRYAIRSNGAKRVAKAVVERDYKGEKSYDAMIARFRENVFGKGFGAAVAGTDPFKSEIVRVAAGKAYAQAYPFYYIMHEIDVTVVAAKNATATAVPAEKDAFWSRVTGEVVDSYTMFVGTGPCAPKKFAEKASSNAAKDVVKALAGLQAAGIARNAAEVEKRRDALAGAVSVIFMNAAISAYGKEPSRASKATAFVFFRYIEAFVAPKAKAQVAEVLKLLDFNCTSKCAAGNKASNALKENMQKIAKANGLKL